MASLGVALHGVRLNLHSEHARIEVAGSLEVEDGEDDVVDAVDLHALPF